MSEEAEKEETVALYPVTAPSLEEQRRAFVLEVIGSGEIDGIVLVRNLDLVYRWLATGEMPVTEKQKKPALKPV